ncbi:MAG: hypothetical protein Q8K02_01095 [Flavobacterium sp.]|nr:hypothetical protein [Flavobacterium sp.]
MKTLSILISAVFLTLGLTLQAQDRTTVRANSMDISDNLDLRAIATIFGDSRDLEDFENRLNDPNKQISNLDLNNDNRVDYLRVIESMEGNTHLIIIQAVLERDIFQDVATIEVEKDNRNRTVQVQVVGDVFLYGNNYIYEPVYFNTPIIYAHFWAPRYHVYYSPWYWNYYPGFYWAWNPYPFYRYRSNVNVFINVNNTCHYVNHRRSSRAIAMHQSRRSNSYERMHPDRGFSARNQNVSNRYELTQNRNATRGNDRANGIAATPRTLNSNGTNTVRNDRSNDRSNSAVSTPRTLNSNATNTVRNDRSNDRATGTVSTPRTLNSSATNTVRNDRSTSTVSTPRTSNSSVTNAPRNNRSNATQIATPRATTPSTYNAPRSNQNSSSQMSTPRNSGSSQMSSANRAPANRSSSMSTSQPQRSQGSSSNQSRGNARGNSRM